MFRSVRAHIINAINKVHINQMLDFKKIGTKCLGKSLWNSVEANTIK